MSLKQICENIYSEVNGAIAVGVVDLSSGMPLEIYHRVEYFTQEYIDLVSAASVDMFRGRNVAKVEEKLANQRRKPLSHSIQEVLMTTEGTIHFMAVLPEKNDILALLVTNKKASVGMGWAILRNALPEISEKV
ncbi:hypothetical protein A7P53_06480 [Acinetobacter defluvii]|uniref:hypothetical protein n=1 Tax=Acinetobacter defluvii TaxID=1871111 RepID=UPI0014901620|nr:hypothetical protein [Acinetobacter defluvii]NNP72110.1 hypothetical protein [Acinetobacter defluvii]